MTNDEAALMRKRRVLATLVELAIPVSMAWICLSVTIVIVIPGEYRNVRAAEGARQADQAAKDSSSALQSLMADIIDAVKKKDSLREQQLIGSLVMPKDAYWFASQFDKNTADLLRSAYDQSMKDFESTTRRRYEADIMRGPINIHVNRCADPKTAPQ